MGKIYISEVIGEEYKEWKQGDIILIKSPTGSGKSEFIKNQLLKWCESQQKSILLLSNRALLFQQQINDIRQKNGRLSDELTLALYQTFSDSIENYDYVVCDECHYFYEDSGFNRETDFVYKQIIQGHSDGIIILLSATPELIEDYLEDKIRKTYTISLNLNNYNLYRYPSRKKVHLIIEQIRKDYPNEKIIYFSSSVQDAYEISGCFKDSAFICSQSNKRYSRYIDKEQRKRIQQDSQFSCSLLCATTALDNGINIKDKQVKHVILDVFSSVSTVQCFGRKRLEEDEQINIYIRDYHGGNFWFHKNMALNELQPYEDYKWLSQEQFAQKYSKRSIGRILDLVPNSGGGFDYIVNECIRDYYKYVVRFCDFCLENEGAYFTHICDKLGINPSEAIDIYVEIELERLELVLKKWIGQKLYKDSNKEQFVEDVFMAVNGRKMDDRMKGLNTINSLINELELPYKLESCQEWSRDSQKRGKTYWIVQNTGKENTEN